MACFNKWDIGQCGCSCTLAVRVQGCNAPVPAGLDVEILTGATVVYSGTTDSSGVYSFSGTAGTYDVRVTDNRTPSRWQTQTFTSQSLACGGQTDVFLSSPKSGYHCLPGGPCGDPWADTLEDTDPNGTWTLTYASSHAHSGYAGWYGCATKTSMASVVTALPPGVCGPPTTGTADVDYVIGIYYDTSDNKLKVACFYGLYPPPGSERTSSTPTCAGGVLDPNAGIPVSCIGSIVITWDYDDTLTIACPPSASLSATVPTGGGGAWVNPGGGNHTITE